MNGVVLSRDRIMAPTSPASRSVVTTPQIVLTVPAGVRPSTAGDSRTRPATRPGMLGHPPDGPPPEPRRFHDMSYSRASDPYEVYRDSSTTLSSVIGRRTHSHPALPMRELRSGPQPSSFARGRHLQQQQQSQQRVDLPRGMLNLDQILQPRKPALPPNARATLKKRTTSHATQTVSTIATQTDAGTTQPPSARGAPQPWARYGGPPHGGKENASEREAAATGGGKYADAYDTSLDVRGRHAAVGPAAPPRWSHGGGGLGGGLGASAPGSAAGSRRVSLTPSSSSEQLEQLDSLLHEHQRRLRERVEGVRVEQARKQKEWFASVKQSLPSPQRLTADALAAGAGTASQPGAAGAQPLSRPGTAPPTPSRLGLTPAASPQRRAGAVNAETSPSSNRSSLESLAELEALLEAQHQQLIQRGYIAPAEEW